DYVTGALVLNVTETWTEADGTAATLNMADNVEAYAAGSPIFAWSGNDFLTASSGDDTIVFAQPIGHDVIHNFDPAPDKVDPIGFNDVTSFDDIIAHLTVSIDGDALLMLGEGMSILFEGVNAASLTADNFAFNVEATMENAGSMVIGDGAMMPLSGII